MNPDTILGREDRRETSETLGIFQKREKKKKRKKEKERLSYPKNVVPAHGIGLIIEG